MNPAPARSVDIEAPEGVRRRRRSREDVTLRICDAARELFAARGYHGTTTREISRHADVSETLLFRYYGSKAALFDEVVAQPFYRLLQTFIEQQAASNDPEGDTHYIFRAVYELIQRNRDLFAALLSPPGANGEDGGGPSFEGFLPFFHAATAAQLKKYADLGQTPPFDFPLGLRLTFGMLASSVLLSDWLFPDGAPSQAAIVSTLETMVTRALGPQVGDPLTVRQGD